MCDCVCDLFCLKNDCVCNSVIAWVLPSLCPSLLDISIAIFLLNVFFYVWNYQLGAVPSLFPTPLALLPDFSTATVASNPAVRDTGGFRLLGRDGHHHHHQQHQQDQQQQHQQEHQQEQTAARAAATTKKAAARATAHAEAQVRAKARARAREAEARAKHDVAAAEAKAGSADEDSVAAAARTLRCPTNRTYSHTNFNGKGAQVLVIGMAVFFCFTQTCAKGFQLSAIGY
jgi:hypothetical protein